MELLFPVCNIYLGFPVDSPVYQEFLAQYPDVAQKLEKSGWYRGKKIGGMSIHFDQFYSSTEIAGIGILVKSLGGEECSRMGKINANRARFEFIHCFGDKFADKLKLLYAINWT